MKLVSNLLSRTGYFAISMVTLCAITSVSSITAKGLTDIIGTVDAEVKMLAEYVQDQAVRDIWAACGITPPKGYLLVGRPGTGKTMLMRSIAEETGTPYIDLSADEVSSSPGAVHKLFEIAREKAKESDNGYCFIFMDEFESIGTRKSSQVSGDTKASIRAMLAEMDGFTQDNSVILFGCTNYPEEIDEALRRPGRFDRTIKMVLPNVDLREKLLKHYAQGVKTHHSINWRILAENTNNFSPADLKNLVNRAGITTLLECANGLPVKNVNKNSICVTLKHFVMAIRRTYTELAAQGVDIDLDLALDKLDVVFDNKKSKLGFASIAGGVNPTIKSLIDMINGVYDLAKFNVPFPKGILLYGPPGTGKTSLIRALAQEAGVEFISVDASNLMTQFVGSGPEGVKRYFAQAREKAAGNRFGKCILFFDEIHALGSQTNGYMGNEMTKTITAFLNEMDGFHQDSSVIVIGATNLPTAMDPAMLREGRFSVKVEIGLPDKTKRSAVLKHYCQDRPVHKGVNLDHLATTTDGKSPAFIRALVERAAQTAMLARAAEITQGHFDAALQELNGSNAAAQPKITLVGA